MTSRERITLLLQHELPDRMGLFEHFWGETLNDYWPAQGYPKGVPPEQHFDYDICFGGGWLDTQPFRLPGATVAETDEWRVVKDGRGASLKYWKHKSGTPEHIAFDCTTPARWQHYREPLLATDIGRLGDLAAARQTLAAARATGRFVTMGNLFIFELMRSTLGDTTFLPALLEEPEWVRDFCQVYLDFYRRHYALYFAEVGLPDGMFIYEDFGFSNGLFCSPTVMQELILPFHRELVGFFNDYRLPVILHSCGDVRRAVPLIIQAGFACLQPMEAKAGCDVREFARLYGRQLAYMGNLNVVPLGTNDPAAVRAEILPKLQAIKELRIPYIFHSDHSIPPEVNYATYQYALELYRAHAAY